MRQHRADRCSHNGRILPRTVRIHFWLAFPGGYYVHQRACLPVVVESAGRSQRVSIGVGTSCPGQQVASALDDPTSPTG